MNRLQRHQHNDRRTVRIGNDSMMLTDIFRIDLRNNQRHVRIHAECAGIVDDDRAPLDRFRRQRLADCSAGEERNINISRIPASLLLPYTPFRRP